MDGLGVPLSQFGVVRATARAFVCDHMVWNFICGAAIVTKNPYQLVLVCLRHWGCSNLFINMPPDVCHVTDRFGTDWAEILGMSVHFTQAFQMHGVATRHDCDVLH